MTNEEFDKLFVQAQASILDYATRQKTQKQVQEAMHHLRSLKINENYYRHQLTSGAQYHLCRTCGKIETSNYHEPTKSQLIERELCFRCNHWTELAVNPRPDFIIVDGDLYTDGGNRPNSKNAHLGFAGRKWRISKDQRIWVTNNLWSGGVIPEEFRNRLPDNARFVK